MSNSIPVKFDTTNIAEDPEFNRLLLDFSNARMALSEYMNKKCDLILQPTQNGGE